MTLSDKIKELEKCIMEDFTVPAGNVPASPFLVNRVVYQHKDEHYEAKDDLLVNQLHKKGLQREIQKIVQVLDEWREKNKGAIWISDTFSTDMNFSLPDAVSPPENTLQVFFIGENMPCFVLTLYNAFGEDGLRNDDKKNIHKFTTSTAKRLKSSLLHFCHDEFAILSCTLDMHEFSVESLKEELDVRKRRYIQFYDGPLRLRTTVYHNVKQAAVLLQGTSNVLTYIPSAPQDVYNNKDRLILLDRAWRDTVHQLIEYLTHTDANPIPVNGNAWKMMVAVLEAAYRLGWRKAVTITSSNNDVNSCVEKLLESHKGKTKLRLEKNGEVDDSFSVTSDFSAITFEHTDKDVATVRVAARGSQRQESTAVEETGLGQFAENTAGMLPTKEDMVTVEGVTAEKVAEGRNFDFTAKGAIKLASDHEVVTMAENKAERVDTDKNHASYLTDLKREATGLFSHDNVWESEGVLHVKKRDGQIAEVRFFSDLNDLFAEECIKYVFEVTSSFSISAPPDKGQPNTSVGHLSPANIGRQRQSSFPRHAQTVR